MNHLLSDEINNLAASQNFGNGRFGKRLKAQGKRHHQAWRTRL
jgi:hypothetical protein